MNRVLAYMSNSIMRTAAVWLSSASNLIRIDILMKHESELQLMIDALRVKDSNLRHLTLYCSFTN